MGCGLLTNRSANIGPSKFEASSAARFAIIGEADGILLIGRPGDERRAVVACVGVGEMRLIQQPRHAFWRRGMGQPGDEAALLDLDAVFMVRLGRQCRYQIGHGTILPKRRSQ